MSFLTNDRYAGGDRDRDRSRGSRDRSAMESDYGRLAERPERLDSDWPYGSGRGRGRSPGGFLISQFSCFRQSDRMLSS
jgi:hypothetical protein